MDNRHPEGLVALLANPVEAIPFLQYQQHSEEWKVRTESVAYYQNFMKHFAVPLNQRAHQACLIMENLGYRFCVDYGYLNAESMLEAKGFSEDLDWQDGMC